MRLPKVVFGEGCDLNTPWLLSRVVDFLFRPNEHLENAINGLYEKIGIDPPLISPAEERSNPDELEEKKRHAQPYISIHYRTGDIAWDPNRHNSTISAFLRCAAKAEEDMGLPSGGP